MLQLLVWALIVQVPNDSNEVTATNWRDHPAIQSARAVYAQVTKSLAQHRLDHRRRYSVDECYDWSELRLATDATNTARYFYCEGGGQDSTQRQSFYYDTSGILRFALLAGAAVTDSTIETRVWFDEEGHEIYRTNEEHGPGWTWINDDPDTLIRNPKERFEKGMGSCKFGRPKKQKK